MMLKKIKKMRAVMMEYVIIAVMVAAAVVVAVMMFGKTIQQEFTVAATAMTSPASASARHKAAQQNMDENAKSADASAKAFHGDNIK